MVVDGYVEISSSAKPEWERFTAECYGLSGGPLAIPHAVEAARTVWRTHGNWKHAKSFRVRVIDTAGVVVEQWPKT